MKNWRAGIRRLVNRDDEPSLWRRVVIRAVDPAESYMRRMEPRPKRGQSRARAGWTYERVSRPSRASLGVHAADLRARSEDAERRRADHLAHLERTREEFGPHFDTKAQTLLEGSPVELRTTGGTITVRLIRFRHGDSVLEWDTVSTDATGHRSHGSMRLDEHSRDVHARIVERLARKVLEFGPNTRPVQE